MDNAVPSNETDSPTCHLAVQLLMIKDGQLLLTRRRNTGFADGDWQAPGGRIKHDEDVLTAVIREADEEVGVQLRRENVDMVSAVHIRSPLAGTRIVVTFHAETWTGGPYNREPEHCSALQWFDFDNIPAAILLSTHAAWDPFLRGEHFGVYGWPQHPSTDG
ncbi:NUDIX domain-containing protein [Nocardia brasiliensis]|uniref:NUDIX domain-containing protein n=1 Tax=Nocardia brasiliensis TaxID=37326 RepID=UPI002458ACFA|nr:NUDIX domain-containing protein [Nocardia brasiliensis]